MVLVLVLPDECLSGAGKLHPKFFSTVDSSGHFSSKADVTSPKVGADDRDSGPQVLHSKAAKRKTIRMGSASSEKGTCAEKGACGNSSDVAGGKSDAR